MSQSEIFLNEEANEWFRRNREKISIHQSFIDIAYINEILSPDIWVLSSILEIGCASGVKLNLLCSTYNSNGVGIDPSSLAIAEANALEKSKRNQLTFQVGVASKLPLDDQSFDLVYFSFCLYLVPPEEIEIAYLEANRVLKPGGFLVITDFDSNIETSKAYHHKPGLFSFKRFNSEYYIRKLGYSLVAKKSYSHESDSFHLDPDERVATEILYKAP